MVMLWWEQGSVKTRTLQRGSSFDWSLAIAGSVLCGLCRLESRLPLVLLGLGYLWGCVGRCSLGCGARAGAPAELQSPVCGRSCAFVSEGGWGHISSRCRSVRRSGRWAEHRCQGHFASANKWNISIYIINQMLSGWRQQSQSVLYFLKGPACRVCVVSRFAVCWFLLENRKIVSEMAGS